METGYVLLTILLVVALVAGACLFIWRFKNAQKQTDTQGMLNIVYDEFGKNPQLVLALYDQVEVVAGQKQVLFDVNIIRQDSRK